MSDSPTHAHSVPLDHLAVVVARFQRARCDAGRLRAAAEQAEAELMAALGNADVGTVNGQVVVRRSAKDRPRFDATRFRAEHPDLFAAYSGPSPRDRLSIPPHSDHPEAATTLPDQTARRVASPPRPGARPETQTAPRALD
jgi:hypothetical protein